MVSKWSSPYLMEMWRATAAPTMENAIPISARVQKGTTSFMKCSRPCLPQAHFRLSQYDGKVATTLPKMVLGTSVQRCSTP